MITEEDALANGGAEMSALCRKQKLI